MGRKCEYDFVVPLPSSLGGRFIQLCFKLQALHVGEFHKGFHFSKVIEEIEEMMQESPDPEDDETPTQSDRLSILSQEIQTLKRSSTNNSYEESKWYLFSIFALT